MNLPEYLLVIIFSGIIIITILLTIWFVYLLRLHRFANKELAVAENASHEEISKLRAMSASGLANLSNNIVEFNKLLQKYAIDFNEVQEKQLNNVINKQMSVFEDVLRDLIIKIDKIESDYDLRLKKIGSVIESVYLNHIDTVKEISTNNLSLFENELSNLVNEARVKLSEDLSREVSMYKDEKIQIIDNVLHNKVKDLWIKIIQESDSYDISVKLIDQTIRELEKDYLEFK